MSWKFLQVVMTSQNVELQELQILLNLDIASHLLHVVWICRGNGLMPIRQQAFNRTHDDTDKACVCHLVSFGHNNNKQKTGWEMHCQKVVACV